MISRSAVTQPINAVNPGSDEGNIYRRQYTGYAGVREGRIRAYSALIGHSVRRALGIRRKWTAKIIPILIYVAAFIPVIGFISVPAIFGTGVITFSTVDLFSAIAMILLIFAAAASPEMLCDDRRENVLQLYYARGLSRLDYLMAKLIALGGLMLSVSLIPALILFLGNTFLEDQPLSHLWDNIDEPFRILGSALTMSLFFASIGLMISAITERKGVASGIYFGVFLAGSAIMNALYEAIGESWARFFLLFSPLDIPEGILMFFFGEAPGGSAVIRADLDGSAYMLTILLIAGVSAAMLYRRYLRED
jgi:ABC-2 type transport system permease protein